jgi:hypothetical protein
MKHPAPRKQKQNTNTHPQHHKLKWATFTYSGKETRKMTKLFKDTKIKITFRTRDTIQNIVKQHSQKDKYNDSGIYKVRCLECPPKYIGQRTRTFHTRYEEHLQGIRNNNSNSGNSNHILNRGHKYGIRTDTMGIIRTQKKKTPKHTGKILHIQSQQR